MMDQLNYLKFLRHQTVMYTTLHTFNGPFSGTTQVSRYQKSKTNLDFTEARDSEWQWHQLGDMQVCTLLQTDNHASTPPLINCYLTLTKTVYAKHSCAKITSVRLLFPLQVLPPNCNDKCIT